MTDPLNETHQMAAALDLAHREAAAYLAEIASSPVLPHGDSGSPAHAGGGLPERGAGTLEALEELASEGRAAAIRSSGPRFFHFVMGGGTPAALGADWLASAFDQVTYGRAVIAFGARTWRRRPCAGSGSCSSSRAFRAACWSPARRWQTSPACAAARHWWSEQLGADVDQDGLLRRCRGCWSWPAAYCTRATSKALGCSATASRRGRALQPRWRGQRRPRCDRDAGWSGLDGPAILIANAGEVNAGDFDPIEAMADLAERHGAWLHVDGAFGLFARLCEASAHLGAGIERADSIAGDAHKWLNVPYESGFAFVREPRRLAAALERRAPPYLPEPAGARQVDYGFISPETSRRARSLAVWATLRAYGRDGYREMVERHLELAQQLAARVDASGRSSAWPMCRSTSSASAPPRRCPGGRARRTQSAVGAALVADGRFYAGTTVYDGRVALRPAIVNWMTREAEIDGLCEVLEELLDGLLAKG